MRRERERGRDDDDEKKVKVSCHELKTVVITLKHTPREKGVSMSVRSRHTPETQSKSSQQRNIITLVSFTHILTHSHSLLHSCTHRGALACRRMLDEEEAIVGLVWFFVHAKLNQEKKRAAASTCFSLMEIAVYSRTHHNLSFQNRNKLKISLHEARNPVAFAAPCTVNLCPHHTRT